MTGSRPCSSSSALLYRIAVSEAVVYIVCLDESACLSVFHVVLRIETSFVFTGESDREVLLEQKPFCFLTVPLPLHIQPGIS